MYQKSVGIGKEYSFGVELEFSNAPLKRVEHALRESAIPYVYQLQHKSCHPTYEEWILDVDATVTKLIEHEFIGGELSSRVLFDQEEDWLELQRVCQLLKRERATCTSRTSTHITVDIARFRKSHYFFEALCKIICAYENDMNIFFMGDKFLLRKTKGDYAASMDYRLRRTLPFIEFDSWDFLNQILHNSNCFGLRDGISFYKLSKGLMEIRYPNGTLREETIQNNVNFVLKLLKAIEEEKFDIGYLDSLIEQDEKDLLFIYRIFHCIENPRRFQELVEMIGEGEDQSSFMGQYQKVLSSRNEKKTI